MQRIARHFRMLYRIQTGLRLCRAYHKHCQGRRQTLSSQGLMPAKVFLINPESMHRDFSRT